jgi:putative pyruvate formate lyase activating enzyme
VPIVSNTSGYERAEVIEMLGGVVQVYLTDMRYWTEESAAKYSGAPDYPAANRAAVAEMLRQVGQLKSAGGAAKTGLIIRHLMIPSLGGETREILRYISQSLSTNTAVSLMSQYFPANRAHLHPELDRRITDEERRAVLDMLDDFQLENGWVQDPDAPSAPVA